MRRLLLVRHAKSSWKFPHLSDFERPLNGRGNRDAPHMGKRLAARGLEPDLVLSSPAARALATAKIIAGALGYPEKKIVEIGDLYGAGIRTFLDALAAGEKRRGKSETVMLVSHNPGVTDLVNYLTGASIGNVPTCGVAVIGFDAERWKGIGRGAGRLVDFDYPKKGK